MSNKIIFLTHTKDKTCKIQKIKACQAPMVHGTSILTWTTMKIRTSTDTLASWAGRQDGWLADWPHG